MHSLAGFHVLVSPSIYLLVGLLSGLLGGGQLAGALVANAVEKWFYGQFSDFVTSSTTKAEGKKLV